MADEPRSEEVQRWTAKRRAQHGNQPAQGGRSGGVARALPARRGERPAVAAEGGRSAREEEVNQLKRKVGELTMDLDILRTANKLRPTTPGTSDE
jgi:hypothetical protein